MEGFQKGSLNCMKLWSANYSWYYDCFTFPTSVCLSLCLFIRTAYVWQVTSLHYYATTAMSTVEATGSLQAHEVHVGQGLLPELASKRNYKSMTRNWKTFLQMLHIYPWDHTRGTGLRT